MESNLVEIAYRLNGLAVRLPSLRERTDLMALVQRILERQCPERRLSLSSEVVRLFQSYNWPGNVRQLFNVLRTAAVMAAHESVITRDHLSDDFIEDALRAAASAQASPAPAPTLSALSDMAPSVALPPSVYAPAPASALPTWPPLGGERANASPTRPTGPAPSEPPRSLQDMEIDAIRRAVEAAGGNISEASKRLEIGRAHV